MTEKKYERLNKEEEKELERLIAKGIDDRARKFQEQGMYTKALDAYQIIDQRLHQTIKNTADIFEIVAPFKYDMGEMQYHLEVLIFNAVKQKIDERKEELKKLL